MSDNTAVAFDGVTKRFALAQSFHGGLKGFLLDLPQRIRTLKDTSTHTALKDVSFRIRRGQAVGIIGRNGSGKSTTLGLIAGVVRPTEGKVLVNGRVSPLLELGAGFHPELSGRENIILNALLLGLTKKEALARMTDIIAFSELGPFIDQPMRTYSSGMFMRLGFSVAVHVDPEILLVDEILAVGDLKFQEKCKQKMWDYKNRGDVTIIFVSHDVQAVQNLCETAILLDQCLVAMGAPQEVIPEYRRLLKLAA